MRVIPRRLVRVANSEASNCTPQSVVMVEGTPKAEIQRATKTRATVSAVMSGIGIASGHLVYRSIQVRR